MTGERKSLLRTVRFSVPASSIFRRSYERHHRSHFDQLPLAGRDSIAEAAAEAGDRRANKVVKHDDAKHRREHAQQLLRALLALAKLFHPRAAFPGWRCNPPEAFRLAAGQRLDARVHTLGCEGSVQVRSAQTFAYRNPDCHRAIRLSAAAQRAKAVAADHGDRRVVHPPERRAAGVLPAGTGRRADLPDQHAVHASVGCRTRRRRCS